MKKIIPLMLVLPLLAGCGKNVKVKEPKFADLGKELSFEEFSEALGKAQLDSEMAKEDLLPSAIIKSASASSSKGDWVRGKTTVRTGKSGSKSELSTKIDMRNAVILTESKGNSFSETKTADVTNKDESKSKSKTAWQEYKGEEHNYIARVDQLEKIYTAQAAIPEEKDAKYEIDQLARGNALSYLSYFTSLIESFPFYSEELQEKYKFYNSDKVFTVVLEDKIENKEVPNLKEETVYVLNSSRIEKHQIDMTDGKMVYRTYQKIESKSEYKMDSMQQDDIIEKGDVITSLSESATEATYTHDASVKVDAVSLKDYVAGSEFK